MLLVLCITILWVRSYSHIDTVVWYQTEQLAEAGSLKGAVYLLYWRHPPPEDGKRLSGFRLQPGIAFPVPGINIVSGQLVWKRPSFIWFSEINSPDGGGGRSYYLIFSDWVLIPILLLLPARRAWLYKRYKDRRLSGKCPSCGYDLRATPQRCPECGWTNNNTTSQT